jgi:hypothetical protein
MSSTIKARHAAETAALIAHSETPQSGCRPVAAVLLEQKIERLVATCTVDAALIENLQNIVAQLCRTAGAGLVDSLGPKIEPANWRTVKQAQFATGFSESNIRRLVKSGELIADKRGGKVLIDASSLSAISAKKRTERTPKQFEHAPKPI